MQQVNDMINRLIIPEGLDGAYCALLLQNAQYKKMERDSQEYRILQRRLLDFERKLTSKEIIAHAEYCFPQVSEP
jgi:hypothetical protein